MVRKWLGRWKQYPLGVCASLLIGAGASFAGDNEAELRSLIEQQGKEIAELRRMLEANKVQPAAAEAADAKDKADDPAKVKIDEGAVKKIVADYLKDNPGSGMPPSVQTGFEMGKGFVIRSAPNPTYVKWDDECKIPFELRFRGRVQFDYYFYKSTDHLNHETGQLYNPAVGDFSQLEIKRLRLTWLGTAFDPNLRYYFELDGNTRGLGGFQNNRDIQTTGSNTPAGAAGAPGIGATPSAIGGGVTVDHAVRIFQGYIAYDFHGCAAEKGCGPDCPPDCSKYAPTYTLIIGKFKPFFALEEIMGSANEQLVEYAMTDWFFDADNDNMMMQAGFQIKAFDDRLFVQSTITNGNESQFPNTQMDRLPGFNGGFWYDLGGSWNEQAKRWDLFGDSLQDIDYSCCPVARVGAAYNIVPLDRRSIYGDEEQSQDFVMAPGPGGTRLINLLNGDGATALPLGSHAVDKFDQYSFETFACFKYRGFSIYNDWYVRDLNNFTTVPAGLGNIIYTLPVAKNGTTNALFPPNHALVDIGQVLQAGYFIVPKKLELAARWAWVHGQSGDIGGNGGTPAKITLPGVGTVNVVNGAFSNYHDANEYAIGVNYYFKRQLLKWQTDFSVYEGGNPAGGGASPAGFTPGVDGWMVRSQIQLWF